MTDTYGVQYSPERARLETRMTESHESVIRLNRTVGSLTRRSKEKPQIFENTEPEIDIDYYKNGNTRVISYKLNDRFHKEDGPAYQEYYDDGRIYVESYFVNGDRHRADGPSVIFYDENGEIGVRLYYLNNIIYKREDWLEELKKMNSPYYKHQKMLYDIDKYNL